MMVKTVVYARGRDAASGAMNVAHRAFAHGPENAQTFQFERGEVENRMSRARGSRLAGRVPRCYSFPSTDFPPPAAA